MTLTEAQRAAIRSDDSAMVEQDPRDADLCYSARATILIDGETFDLPTVRALMRLGLCVVESGVTAGTLRYEAAFMDICAASPALVAMLDALAAEMERAK